jgi:hypothetical protein
MSKIQAQGPWTITNAVQRPSKYHDSDYTYITMRNSQGDIVHTNIEEDFNNNTYWSDVLEALDKNYDVVIDNINYKTKYGKIVTDNRTGNPVIDADSKPTIKSLTKNLDKQADADRKIAYNNTKTQELVNLGITQTNGKWDIKCYMDKNGEFVDDLNPQKGDNIELIREKLKVKTLIKHADMLNRSLA